MKVFGAFLVGRFYWKIHVDDPVTHDLQSLPGWFFINPLVYPEIELRSKINTEVILLSNDTTIAQTSGLIIATKLKQFDISSIPFPIEPPQITKLGTPNPEDDIFDIASTYIEHLAASLRQASKQVTVPMTFTHSSNGELAELPEKNFPQSETIAQSFLQQYIWETAITWKAIIDADVNLIAQKPDVYERLILDAIHALKDRDYRRSLLYAAIAVETLIATKLDEAYKSLLHSDDSKGIFRVVSIPQRGNTFVKDPVYEFLSSKSRFAERIHEVSLYLLGKSLLVDNEALYHKVTKLYRTRNKIAHLGESPAGNQSTFEMNESDSLEAIGCSLKVFEWLDVKTKFPLPEFGFVRGYSPRNNEKV
jgi:hypothetical protein